MIPEPLHAAIVHFPVALLTMGVIAQFLSLWKNIFNTIAIFMLSIGFITGIAAYLTGDGAEDFAEHVQGKDINMLLERHEFFAVATLIIFAAVLALHLIFLRRRPAIVTLLLLLLCAGGGFTITMTGHYGGEMVYHSDSQDNTGNNEDSNESEEDHDKGHN
ncbi:hypothetical protein EHS13_02580 [Paenibacillus psychroresistens]|uniref:DUF2231 domain-containing protein n=1 Tax=Paenibacillus psychroresistens TaxID=1778678 RepID=A0A6B8RBZ2_9BACL|nr:DUF2231 domain-containing protein [Paenibacillus psychroresistens]QGQ93869.1 hypothetical protein EHS13_02580 [Paenibacillus psychroresistens]